MEFVTVSKVCGPVLDDPHPASIATNTIREKDLGVLDEKENDITYRTFMNEDWQRWWGEQMAARACPESFVFHQR